MAELKKVLSFRVILLITINSIMGTGIFFLPATGAKHAGPASLISWIILSFVAIYISMCFAELTSMFPKSGGVYEFCKQAYGRFWSFIIGWMTFIAGNVTIAMLVVGAITYLAPQPGARKIIIPLCLFFVYLFNYIAYLGVKTSATMLVTFAFITLGTVFALIIPGLIKFNSGNFSPFFIEGMGISAIMVTIFFIAETFFGWETATFLAAETKDGEKVMPKVLILATVIIAIISLLSVISSLGVIHWQEYSLSIAPLSDLAFFHYGALGKDIFTILVYLSIIGSVAGWIVSAPRLVLAMAEDKLFLSQLAEIHPTRATPYKAIIFQTVVITLFVFVGASSKSAYIMLLELLVPMVLVMYSFVLFSLVVLRIKKPEIQRYYRAPFAMVGVPLTVLFMLFLIFMWLTNVHGAFNSLLFAGSFVLAGIPLYFLLEMFYNPKSIMIVNDLLAYLFLLTESFSLPKRIRIEVLNLLGNIHGKRILEFGCSVGTLTKHLAEEVGPQGKIYASDISIKRLKITDKRMKKKNYMNVVLIHDQEHTTRVHPSIPKVNVIASVGMLSYVTDVKKVLRELYSRLDQGGNFCFVEYGKFFNIIPNIAWLNKDEEILKLFKECGFTVRVLRKQGLLWEYVFVYGIKGGQKDMIYI